MMGSLVSIPKYFFFCASLPPRRMGVRARTFAVMLVWIPVQPYASSSVIIAFSSSPIPAPPYSAGQVVLTRPISQASLKTCMGKRDSRSASAATGMMRSFVKRRAVSTRAFCSSVRENSITVSLLHPSALLLELGAHGAGPQRVPCDEPDQQRERDVDEVGRRHLAEVRHHAAPSSRGGGLGVSPMVAEDASASRALSMAPSSATIRASIRRWRRQESRISAKRMTQMAA